MIFMFIFYNDEGAMARLSTDARNALVERHIEYNFDYLTRHTTLIENRALQPTGTAFTIRPAGGGQVVREGPFEQTEQALSGFYLVDCADMDEAVELARAYPMPEGLGCIEVRPALQTWDYAPSVDTAASASTVWGFYSDVLRWPEWKTGIDLVELDGPFAAGTRGLLTPTGQPAMPFHIVEAEPGISYTSETELTPGVRLRLSHMLTPQVGGGTRITHRASIPRAALDTFGLNFSPDFNAGIRTTLRTLSSVATAAEAAHR